MSLFGGNGSNNNLFGGKSGNSGLFGNSMEKKDSSGAEKSSGLNLFGNASNNASKDNAGSSPFNFSSTPAASSSNIFGGSSTTTTNTGDQSTSLFGSNKANENTSSSLFSSSAPKDSNSGSLFGSSVSESNQSSSLFGNTTQSSEKTSTTLFTSKTDDESKPVTSTSLFGTTNTSTVSKTNESNDSGAAATSSSSLFANDKEKENTSESKASSLFETSNNETKTPSAPDSTSLFGKTTTNKEAEVTNLFGGNTASKGPETNNLFGSTAGTGTPTKASDSLFGASASTAKPTENVANTQESKPEAKKAVTFDITKNQVKTIESNATADGNKNPSTGPIVNQPSDKFSAIDLNGLSIEDIISKWHEKLAKHLDLFQKTADKVRERDLVLFKNQMRITDLAKEAQLLKAEQDELQWKLDSIDELQSELGGSLDQIEKELVTLDAKKPKVYNEEIYGGREAAYDTIAKVNMKLNEVEERVDGANSTLDSLLEIKFPDNGKMTNVLEAIQKNQASLDYLEKLTSSLELEVSTCAN